MINVVIVEDDYRIGNIHEEFLKKIEGFHVVGKALNGNEALQLVKEKQVDLLLLDIYMPDILGTKVMSEIRKVNIKVDIIVISAATEKEIIEDVIHFGAFDYIIKPVKMNRFIQTLRRYKKVKLSLESNHLVNQAFLDQYFGKAYIEEDHGAPTPKGIDPITLEKIEKIMYRSLSGITADEMGKKIGVSRTTARRYLEYLISEEQVTAELEYGAVGRPERSYFAVE